MYLTSKRFVNVYRYCACLLRMANVNIAANVTLRCWHACVLTVTS